MPFLGQDWRSPGQSWVKTADGWKRFLDEKSGSFVSDLSRYAVPPPTCGPAEQAREGVRGRRARRGARRGPLAGEVGASGPVSAEVAGARDAEDLVSLFVQGQRLQVGATLHRTPGPSENLSTNVELVRTRSHLSTHLEVSPAVNTPEWRSSLAWGRGRVGPAPFTARVAGLQAPEGCGHSRVTALDAGSAGAPPGSSHARSGQATTEWAERMSNQEGAARRSLGHRRLHGGFGETRSGVRAAALRRSGGRREEDGTLVSCFCEG